VTYGCTLYADLCRPLADIIQNVIKISTRDQFQITLLCFGFCRTYVAAKGWIRVGSFPADMLQCNIWRRAQSPHRMTHSRKITYLMHTLCILCINFVHTMCRLCETCDLGGGYPPKSLLHLMNSQGAACLPQRVKSQLAWFGARGTPSATASFGAGGARTCT
jgi:hypothetical protein